MRRGNRKARQVGARSTRTLIPGNSTTSTVMLVMAGNTLPKLSLVPLADLRIHGTANRADLKESHHRAVRAEAMAVSAEITRKKRLGKRRSSLCFRSRRPGDGSRRGRLLAGFGDGPGQFRGLVIGRSA